MEDPLSILLEKLTGAGLVDDPSRDDQPLDFDAFGRDGRSVFSPTRQDNDRLRVQIAESQFATDALKQLRKDLNADQEAQVRAAAARQEEIDQVDRDAFVARSIVEQEIDNQAFGNISEEQRAELDQLRPEVGILARNRAKTEVKKTLVANVQAATTKEQRRAAEGALFAFNDIQEEIDNEVINTFGSKATAAEIYEDMNLAERFDNPTQGLNPFGLAGDILGKAIAGVGDTIQLATNLTPIDAITDALFDVRLGDVAEQAGEDLGGFFQTDTLSELLGSERLNAAKQRFDETGDKGQLLSDTFSALDFDTVLDLATSTLALAGTGGAVGAAGRGVAKIGAKSADDTLLKDFNDAITKAKVKVDADGPVRDAGGDLVTERVGRAGLGDNVIGSGIAAGAGAFSDLDFEDSSNLERAGAAAVAGVGGALTGLIPGTIERGIFSRLGGSPQATGLTQRALTAPEAPSGVLRRAGEAGIGAAGGIVRGGGAEAVQEGAQNLVGQGAAQFSDNPGFDAGSLIQDSALGFGLGGAIGGPSGAIARGGRNADPALKAEFDRLRAADQAADGPNTSIDDLARQARVNIATGVDGGEAESVAPTVAGLSPAAEQLTVQRRAESADRINQVAGSIIDGGPDSGRQGSAEAAFQAAQTGLLADEAIENLSSNTQAVQILDRIQNEVFSANIDQLGEVGASRVANFSRRQAVLKGSLDGQTSPETLLPDIESLAAAEADPQIRAAIINSIDPQILGSVGFTPEAATPAADPEEEGADLSGTAPTSRPDFTPGADIEPLIITPLDDVVVGSTVELDNGQSGPVSFIDDVEGGRILTVDTPTGPLNLGPYDPDGGRVDIDSDPRTPAPPAQREGFTVGDTLTSNTRGDGEIVGFTDTGVRVRYNTGASETVNFANTAGVNRLRGQITSTVGDGDGDSGDGGIEEGGDGEGTGTGTGTGSGSGTPSGVVSVADNGGTRDTSNLPSTVVDQDVDRISNVANLVDPEGTTANVNQIYAPKDINLQTDTAGTTAEAQLNARTAFAKVFANLGDTFPFARQFSTRQGKFTANNTVLGNINPDKNSNDPLPSARQTAATGHTTFAYRAPIDSKVATREGNLARSTENKNSNQLAHAVDRGAELLEEAGKIVRYPGVFKLRGKKREPEGSPTVLFRAVDPTEFGHAGTVNQQVEALPELPEGLEFNSFNNFLTSRKTAAKEYRKEVFQALDRHFPDDLEPDFGAGNWAQMVRNGTSVPSGKGVEALRRLLQEWNNQGLAGGLGNFLGTPSPQPARSTQAGQQRGGRAAQAAPAAAPQRPRPPSRIPSARATQPSTRSTDSSQEAPSSASSGRNGDESISASDAEQAFADLAADLAGDNPQSEILENDVDVDFILSIAAEEFEKDRKERTASRRDSRRRANAEPERPIKETVNDGDVASTVSRLFEENSVDMSGNPEKAKAYRASVQRLSNLIEADTNIADRGIKRLIRRRAAQAINRSPVLQKLNQRAASVTSLLDVNQDRPLFLDFREASRLNEEIARETGIDLEGDYFSSIESGEFRAPSGTYLSSMGVIVINNKITDKVNADETFNSPGTLELLAHEYIHAITTTLMKSATPKEIADLARAYSKWFDENYTRDLREVSSSISPPAHAGARGQTAQDREYVMRLTEFLADQGAVFLARETASTEVDAETPSLLRRIVQGVRQFYDFLVEQFNIDPDFDTFFTNRLRETPREINNQVELVDAPIVVPPAELRDDSYPDGLGHSGSGIPYSTESSRDVDREVYFPDDAPLIPKAKRAEATRKRIAKIKAKLPGIKIETLRPSELTANLPGTTYNDSTTAAFLRDGNGKPVIYINPDLMDSQSAVDTAVFHAILRNRSQLGRFAPQLDNIFASNNNFASPRDLVNYAVDNEVVTNQELILQADALEGDRRAITEISERVLKWKVNNNEIDLRDAEVLSDIGSEVKRWMRNRLPGDLNDFQALTLAPLEMGQVAVDLSGRPRTRANIQEKRQNEFVVDDKRFYFNEDNEIQEGNRARTIAERSHGFINQATPTLIRVVNYLTGLVKMFEAEDVGLEFKKRMQLYLVNSANATNLGGRLEASRFLDSEGNEVEQRQLELSPAEIRLLKSESLIKVGNEAAKALLNRISNSSFMVNTATKFQNALHEFNQNFHEMRNVKGYNHHVIAKHLVDNAQELRANFSGDKNTEELFAEGGAFDQFTAKILGLDSTAADYNQQLESALAAHLKTDQVQMLALSRLKGQAQDISVKARQALHDVQSELGGTSAEAANTLGNYIAAKHLVKDNAAMKSVFDPFNAANEFSRAKTSAEWLNANGKKQLEALRKENISPEALHKRYMDLFVTIDDSAEGYTLNTNNLTNGGQTLANRQIKNFTVNDMDYTKARKLAEKIDTVDSKKQKLLEKGAAALRELNDKVVEIDTLTGNNTREDRKRRQAQKFGYFVPTISQADVDVSFDRVFLDNLAKTTGDRVIRAASPVNAGFLALEQAFTRAAEARTKHSLFLNALNVTNNSNSVASRLAKKNLTIARHPDGTLKVRAVKAGSKEHNALFTLSPQGKFTQTNSNEMIINMSNDTDGEITNGNDNENNDTVLVFELSKTSDIIKQIRTPIPRGLGYLLRQKPDKWWARALLGATPLIAAAKTKFNAHFPLVQAQRDTLGAWVTQAMNYGPDGARDFGEAMEDMRPHFGGIARYMALRTSNKPNDVKRLKEIVAQGGDAMAEFDYFVKDSGAYISHEASYRRNSRFIKVDDSIIERMFSTNNTDKIDDGLRAIGLLTEFTDVWARFALYKAELDQQVRNGLDRNSNEAKQNAAVAAKRLANFEERGAGAAADTFRVLYAFYGPGATGVSQLLHTAMRGKYNTEALALMAGVGGMTVFALAGLSGEDEDGNNLFLSQSDNVSDIKIFFGDYETPVSLKLPFSAASAVMAGTMQLTKLAGGHQSVDKTNQNLLNIFAHNLLPVQDDNTFFNEVGEFAPYRKLTTAVPTVLKPWAQLATNVNSFGYDILKDGSFTSLVGRGGALDSKTLQVGSALEKFVRLLSKEAGIDINPRFADHIIREYTGGVYTMIEGLNEIFNYATMRDYDPNLREASLFFGGLIGTPINNIHRQYHSTRIEGGAKVRSVDASVKAGDTLEEAAEAHDLTVDEYKALKEFVNKHGRKNQVGEFITEARAARFAYQLSTVERQQLIDNAYDNQTPLMREAMDALPESLKKLRAL